MPAQSRFDIAHTPKHIIQRGVDRCACFRHKGDYRQSLDELGQAAKRHGCAIHAYVLMNNHVHLLVTAAEDGARASPASKSSASRRAMSRGTLCGSSRNCR